jgi:putative DNA primase/helicase
VVERLLSLSGEDKITIERKYRDAVHVRLPVRFMLLSNEVPRLLDPSGAIAGRFIVLTLKNSFYGREDLGLKDKLASEMTGIMNWAIDGLRMLREAGHFTQPESGKASADDLTACGSPVKTFAEEMCVIGQGHRIPVANLYVAWTDFCERNGYAPTSRETFGRDLKAAYPHIEKRGRSGSERFYDGIALATGHADTIAKAETQSRFDDSDYFEGLPV